MARIRTIKPEFPQSESMGRVSRDARLLFVQMWTIADDSGRLRGNSRMLASLLFPYDDDAPGLISTWLGELERESCIRCYRGPDGSNYVAICKWSDHQKIDKPSKSRIPGPDSENSREDSRGFENSREASIPSRARADRDLDQGPRTKEGTKDQNTLSASADSFDDSEPVAGVRKPCLDDFEEFWQAFPKTRRTKKREALRKWKLVTKTVDAGLLTTRAADYAASPKGRSEFAVMPSVFLNSGMWEDDPEAWGVAAEEPNRTPTAEQLANWNPVNGGLV